MKKSLLFAAIFGTFIGVWILVANAFYERSFKGTAAAMPQPTSDELVRDFEAAAWRAHRAAEMYCAKTSDPWCRTGGPSPLQAVPQPHPLLSSVFNANR